MNIVGTGLTGLVGSRVAELLSSKHTFDNLSLETGVDITDHDALRQRVTASNAPWVFHFAALTDVDRAESERDKGQESTAWKVNVSATQALVDVCRDTGKRLLYISTDYVFDGLQEYYTEDQEPSPQGWYGITKYEGEKSVARLGETALIVRIANPYRPPWNGRQDFVQKIVARLRDGQTVEAPTDQVFVPTLIDDIAYALDRLVEKRLSGIYHAVGSEVLTPYEAALAIAEAYSLPIGGVRETTFVEYFKDRAPRPLHAYLKNDKITGLGITMHTFREGLSLIQSGKEHTT